MDLRALQDMIRSLSENVEERLVNETERALSGLAVRKVKEISEQTAVDKKLNERQQKFMKPVIPIERDITMELTVLRNDDKLAIAADSALGSSEAGELQAVIVDNLRKVLDGQ
jgi:hypothetical protein